MLPVKPGSPTKPVPGYDVRVLGEDNRRCRAGRDRLRSRSSCRCRRAACPTLWNNDAGLREVLPHAASRLLPDGRRRLPGRGRLRLHHEPRGRHHQRRRASALDRRAWKRSWPPIPTWPSAPWSAWPTSSRARCPSGSWSPRPGVAAQQADIVRELVRARARAASARSPRSRPAIGGQAPAQDALGQDPARDDQEDRRRPRVRWCPATIDDPVVLDEITAALGTKGYRSGSAPRRHCRRHCHHRHERADGGEAEACR